MDRLLGFAAPPEPAPIHAASRGPGQPARRAAPSHGVRESGGPGRVGAPGTRDSGHTAGGGGRGGAEIVFVSQNLPLQVCAAGL